MASARGSCYRAIRFPRTFTRCPVGGWRRLSCVVVSLGILIAPAVAAGQPAGSCDLKALERSKGEFRRLSALRRFNASAASDDDVRAASRNT